MGAESGRTKSWWDAARTAENLEWLAKNDGVLKHHLDRYKYPERYNETDGRATETVLSRIISLAAKQPPGAEQLSWVAAKPVLLTWRCFVCTSICGCRTNWFENDAGCRTKIWLAQLAFRQLFAHYVLLPTKLVVSVPWIEQ